MILMKDGQLVRGGIAGRIDGWTTWFQVPSGYCETLQEAVAWCSSQELDPDWTIIPVPVARSGDHYEVFQLR